MSGGFASGAVASGNLKTASTFTLTAAYTQFTPNDGNETRTRNGFTGHEMVDGAGIVHMGGRIYDRESTADSPSSEGLSV